jgi:hypothetical protein
LPVKQGTVIKCVVQHIPNINKFITKNFLHNKLQAIASFDYQKSSQIKRHSMVPNNNNVSSTHGSSSSGSILLDQSLDVFRDELDRLTGAEDDDDGTISLMELIENRAKTKRMQTRETNTTTQKQSRSHEMSATTKSNNNSRAVVNWDDRSRTDDRSQTLRDSTSGDFHFDGDLHGELPRDKQYYNYGSSPVPARMLVKQKCLSHIQEDTPQPRPARVVVDSVRVNANPQRSTQSEGSSSRAPLYESDKHNTRTNKFNASARSSADSAERQYRALEQQQQQQPEQQQQYQSFDKNCLPCSSNTSRRDIDDVFVPLAPSSTSRTDPYRQELDGSSRQGSPNSSYRSDNYDESVRPAPSGIGPAAPYQQEHYGSSRLETPSSSSRRDNYEPSGSISPTPSSNSSAAHYRRELHGALPREPRGSIRSATNATPSSRSVHRVNYVASPRSPPSRDLYGSLPIRSPNKNALRQHTSLITQSSSSVTSDHRPQQEHGRFRPSPFKNGCTGSNSSGRANSMDHSKQSQPKSPIIRTGSDPNGYRAGHYDPPHTKEPPQQQHVLDFADEREAWKSMVTLMRDTLDRQDNRIKVLERDNEDLRRANRKLVDDDRQRTLLEEEWQGSSGTGRTSRSLYSQPRPEAGHENRSLSPKRISTRASSTRSDYTPPRQSPPSSFREFGTTTTASKSNGSPVSSSSRKLFSPGTRFVGDLSQVMEIDKEHQTSLSFVMDNHYERVAQIRDKYGWHSEE